MLRGLPGSSDRREGANGAKRCARTVAAESEGLGAPRSIVLTDQPGACLGSKSGFGPDLSGSTGILPAANCTQYTDLTTFFSVCPARIPDFLPAVLAVPNGFRSSFRDYADVTVPSGRGADWSDASFGAPRRRDSAHFDRSRSSIDRACTARRNGYMWPCGRADPSFACGQGMSARNRQIPRRHPLDVHVESGELRRGSCSRLNGVVNRCQERRSCAASTILAITGHAISQTKDSAAACVV